MAPKKPAESWKRALEEGIERLEGLKKFAAAMGVSMAAVGNWRARGVPRGQAILFEEKTGIPRWRICPKHFQRSATHSL
jgi:hypothetical protein